MAFLVATAVFLIAGGKGYYLAGAIVPLVAAGCTALAARWPARRHCSWRRHGLVGRRRLAGLRAGAAGRTYASSFYPALDSDQLETIGWPEFADTVRATVESLPADERDTAVVSTLQLRRGGRAEWYGLGSPVFSGHNAFGDWGPPPEGARPVIVIGLADPGANFTDCHTAAMIITMPVRTMKSAVGPSGSARHRKAAGPSSGHVWSISTPEPKLRRSG